jgi:hypothetical protein
MCDGLNRVESQTDLELDRIGTPSKANIDSILSARLLTHEGL